MSELPPDQGEARALLQRIERLAMKSRLLHQLAPDDRDEVVQEVAVAVVLDQALDAVQTRGAEDSYVRAMLANKARDHFRAKANRLEVAEAPARARREGAVALDDALDLVEEAGLEPEELASSAEGDGPGGGSGGDEPGGQSRREDAARLKAVHRQASEAAERAIEARKARYREDARATWRQIERIAFEDASVDALLAVEGAGPGAPPAERKKAEQRLYQAHSRFRREMEDGVGAAEAAGALTGAQAAFQRRCLGWLYRGGPGGAATKKARDGS